MWNETYGKQVLYVRRKVGGGGGGASRKRGHAHIDLLAWSRPQVAFVAPLNLKFRLTWCPRPTSTTNARVVYRALHGHSTRPQEGRRPDRSGGVYKDGGADGTLESLVGK